MPFNPFSALASKIYGAIAIAALLVAAVQTIRIDGFLWIDGYVEKLSDARQTIKDMEQASRDAEAAAIANKARVEAEYQKEADNAKADYDSRLASMRGNLDKWVRQNNRGSARQADSASVTQGTTGTVDASGASLVPEGYAVVSYRDLDLTAQGFAKLEALQGWARSVGEVETQ